MKYLRDQLNNPVRDDAGYWQALGTLELGCRVMYAGCKG